MAEPKQPTNVTPVILAGGSGSRLWPLSRRTYPKHLLSLSGERTLLQQAAARALGAAPATAVLTIGGADEATPLELQLAEVDAGLVAGLLLEPVGRNTAAACAAAALEAERRFGPERILWVCPADHVIEDVEVLYDALADAVPAAEVGRLVTFGISPTHPEPGFGYIRVAGARAGRAAVYDVAAFVEKPSRARAQAMLAAGGHLWNSGMFVFRVDAFLEELGALAPDILDATRRAVRTADGTPRTFGPAYAEIPPAPVDKAVMERSDRVAVVPCDPAWSDVGTWRAVWERSARDARDNAAHGDVVLDDAHGCLVVGGERLVAAVGVDDLVVVDTRDAVLVARRDDAEGLKALVERLGRENRAEAEGYVGERGLWGERRRLVADGPVVRELRLAPGRSLAVDAPADRALHLFANHLPAPRVLAPGERLVLTNATDAPQTFVEVEGTPASASTS